MLILSKEQFKTLNSICRDYGYVDDKDSLRGLQSVSKVAARIQKLGYTVRVVKSNSVLDVELKVDIGVVIEDKVYCFQVKSGLVGAQKYIKEVEKTKFRLRINNGKIRYVLRVSSVLAPDCLVPGVTEVMLIPAAAGVKPRFFGRKNSPSQTEAVSYSASNALLSKTGKRLYGAALQARIGKLVRTTQVNL